MPLGQLFTSLAAVREAIGNPIGKNFDFSDNYYNETSLLNFFNWAFNLTTDLSSKGTDKENLSSTETTTNSYNSSTPDYPDIHNADSLSIMWYLVSFGTLVMFFLLISFSEVCCKKSMTEMPEEPEVSPPPYDLFAPPNYDSLFEKKKEKNSKRKKKRKCEVFVINVLNDKNVTRALPSEITQSNDSRREAR